MKKFEVLRQSFDQKLIYRNMSRDTCKNINLIQRMSQIVTALARGIRQRFFSHTISLCSKSPHYYVYFNGCVCLTESQAQRQLFWHPEKRDCKWFKFVILVPWSQSKSILFRKNTENCLMLPHLTVSQLGRYLATYIPVCPVLAISSHLV